MYKFVIIFIDLFTDCVYHIFYRDMHVKHFREVVFNVACSDLLIIFSG